MKLILCIIAAEAMVQLICKAEIFDGIRNWIMRTNSFMERLLSCPYCVSVWVAAFTTALYFYWGYSFPFVLMLVIHRGSNLLHDIYRIVLNVKVDQVLHRRRSDVDHY